MKVLIFALFAAFVAITLASEDELERAPRSAVWGGRSGYWGSPAWGGYGYGGGWGWGRNAWGWGRPSWGLRSSWGYPAWGGRAWTVAHHGGWW